MAIKFSSRFAILLLLLHTLAALAVCVTALPPMFWLALSLPIALSLIYYFARDIFLLLKNSWREFSFDQGEVSVIVRDGSSYVGWVANGSFVSPYFIVLLVNLEGHWLPASRVFFPDALERGKFRELCVRLRYA